MKRRALEVRDAVITMPSGATWLRCALLYVGFLICAMPIGLLSGLLHPSLPPLTLGASIVTALTIALHPAFTEELVFRGFMLPRLRVSPIAIVIALFLYVVAHPLNAMFFWPAVWPIFSNPYYLAMATLLGLTCTTAYLISGSIWPSVVIHWLTVTLWILLLGGQRLLQSGG
ncbi:MAG TPA: CPBP family glutamic-type intramembrane protease [Vicinamibacterales bacterium]|nr:CPBP family glutamic-type intramembrane protease [Vicinamibacterales bacterium]